MATEPRIGAAELMDVAEVRQAIATAAALRVPQKDPDDPTAKRVEAMEDFILRSAYVRGDLEEARLVMEGVKELKRDEWEAIEGWEMATSSRPSKEEVWQAKRKLNPQLADALREVERILSKIDRQVRRLEADERVVSRAYTFLTGN